MTSEPIRQLPVRPNLRQLKHQAKEYLRALHDNDPTAVAEYQILHRNPTDPKRAKLTDAQYVLAKSYGLTSWPRLVAACEMTEAIWQNDLATIHNLINSYPKLITESARGIPDNWGAPLAYAATAGRPEVVHLMKSLGAIDIQPAFERACLKGHISIAEYLITQGAKPQPGSVMGPCETLNSEGLAFQLSIGAEFADENGNRLAPVGLLLEVYARNAIGKHRCLEIAIEQGAPIPDTPTMAIHRGRIDLLEKHLTRDANLFSRTFRHEEIFPRELGCNSDPTYALCGSPLEGTTLLHMCVDYDEYELAEWILNHGGPVDVPAEYDAEGFGGHTALFGCVISQPYRAQRGHPEGMTRLLLKHGANPNARASIRKALRFVADESWHAYRDVTPLGLGEVFHDQDWVSPVALNLIREAGGLT